MRKLCLSAFLSVLSLALFQIRPAAAASGASTPPEWPTIERQLAQDRIIPGSALAALVSENQDFSVLRAGETRDKIAIPLWLRVYWRKAHPEAVYSAQDPTGGYPPVLKEVHRWMLAHQSLRSSFQNVGPSPGMAIAGSRSESDVRIHFFSPNQTIRASRKVASRRNAFPPLAPVARPPGRPVVIASLP
jgi:hypothetical protein